MYSSETYIAIVIYELRVQVGVIVIIIGTSQELQICEWFYNILVKWVLVPDIFVYPQK